MKRRHMMENPDEPFTEQPAAEPAVVEATSPKVKEKRKQKSKGTPTRRNPPRKAKPVAEVDAEPPALNASSVDLHVAALDPSPEPPEEERARPKGCATLQELKQVASQRQLQTAKAVCPFVRDSLAVLPVSYQCSVGLLVLSIATDITISNRRKRVMVRDVEPLVQLVKALSKMSS
jgi:hypothetical protein